MGKLRAGVQRIENGIEIPTNAKEFESKSGRKCYLSGISKREGKFVASVRYIDTGEFTEVDFERIEKLI